MDFATVIDYTQKNIFPENFMKKPVCFTHMLFLMTELPFSCYILTDIYQ